ncbi:anti-sigma-I factor RsgI family protein [Desulfotomaculum sp. 1211_IL3151]|uniref:anti-sigma-I factor RsgI family protein n=1 Tax=Desulfotomaculum sp. 1211_IL3151 TaxID=3084055 RepID=UPI002FD95C32
MTKITGILVQKKGPIGVLMTSEGYFVRVLLTGKNHILGQEILGLKYPSLIQGMAAASVLVVVLIGIWSKFLISPAAAYVALDINPSVELAVNKSGTVIKASGLNEDGMALLEKVTPKKMEIYQAVEMLLKEAVNCNYLNDNNNIVLATVIPSTKNQTVVDQDKLESTVQISVAEIPAPIKVVTESATKQDHRLAEAKGLSVGRYLIYQGSSQKGGKINLDELKTKGLGELEKEKGIEIQQYLPHPKAKAKVGIKVMPSSGSQEFQFKEKMNQEKYPNKNLPPGQLMKQESGKSSVNWRVLPNHPVNKEIQSRGDDRDEGKLKETRENDNQKRRDDRRQSHMDNKKSKDKEQRPAQPNAQKKERKEQEKEQKEKEKKIKDQKKNEQKEIRR